jgi:6-phosphogluconate dehydrogenase
MGSASVGLVGLGVMGSSLARNLERNGCRVVVHNRDRERIDEFLDQFGEGRSFVGAETYTELLRHLVPPRTILLMVVAGSVVDSVLSDLTPLLSAGDIVIDGGNSHYRDTERRSERLAARAIEFVGMGVSGGEEGALNGPSLMPGGSKRAYERLAPVLRSIAAVSDSGPCVTHVGPGGSGHFVKMVHNGIEYADMQLICEAYDLLRRGMRIPPADLAEVFAEWNTGELQSYLVEITSRIVGVPDDQGAGGILLDHVLDAAGEKGTGRWTTQSAMDFSVPAPALSSAVDARFLSSLRDERQRAAAAYRHPEELAPLGREFLPYVRSALYAAKVCSYAQGFALIKAASTRLSWGVDLGEMARIWKAGCIIRAGFLDRIRDAYGRDPELPNLLLDPSFREEIEQRLADWRKVVVAAVERGIPMPAMSASLAYFDSYTSARLPANLLQAQRDYFGAHTYQRTDREGSFHTNWVPLD